MDPKKIARMQAASLMTIGVVTLILITSSIMEIQLPGVLTAILGIMALISLPVLVFSTIRKLQNKSQHSG